MGARGRNDVPIARAVLPSSALPGLFPPVEIDGRYYVDGALVKTLHASVALRAGAGLLLCINPLVRSTPTGCSAHTQEALSLVKGGLPVVLAQTFRAIIHSRMKTGMDRYRTEFPNADVLLFQPNRDDSDMFFTNVFSYSARRRLSEHAYQMTRADLRRRAKTLAPILARHGIKLDRAVLADKSRTLSHPVGTVRRERANSLGRAARQLDRALDDLGALLQTRSM